MNIILPPLPELDDDYIADFSTEKMIAYATAAVEADRASRAQPDVTT